MAQIAQAEESEDKVKKIFKSQVSNYIDLYKMRKTETIHDIKNELMEEEANNFNMLQ